MPCPSPTYKTQGLYKNCDIVARNLVHCKNVYYPPTSNVKFLWFGDVDEKNRHFNCIRADLLEPVNARAYKFLRGINKLGNTAPPIDKASSIFWNTFLSR